MRWYFLNNDSSSINLVYQSNGDANGLVYYLGTNQLATAFVSPWGSKIIGVSGGDAVFFDRNSATFAVGSGIIFRFSGYKIKPTRLTVQAPPATTGIGNGNVYRRSILGSIDGSTWFPLAHYVSSDTLANGAWWSPNIATSEFIQYIQFGNPQESYNFLQNVAEFEIYGEVIKL